MSNEVIKKILERAEGEPYSRIFGFNVTALEPGFARVEMEFSERLHNIHGMAHGGAIFSLMDEAFQLASNSHGTTSVALNVHISFLEPPPAGLLAAEAREINRTARTGLYELLLLDPGGRPLARGQGLVYRKKEQLPFLAE